MKVMFIMLGIIVGTAIAWILNKLLAVKVEEKRQKLGLQITAYIICILLGSCFTFIFSLRTILDGFIDTRINTIEISLSRMFPNSNILDINLDTNELVLINTQLQQSINDIDKSNDDFFEKLIFDAFINGFSDYINALNTGVNTLAMMSDASGMVTMRSILYNLKNIALNAVEPYFIIGNIIITILLIIFIGIYIGIVNFLKKGGAMYNKSIVFGEIVHDDKTIKFRNKE